MSKVLTRIVSHREFLKMCGLALVGAGASQVVVPPQPVSAETFNDLTVYGNTYLATTSGNVGIGTNSPGYKLAVNGTGYFSNNLSTDGTLTVWDPIYLKGQQQAYVSNSNSAIYGTGASGSSYPFQEAGNLVIQSRSSGALRDIVFATGNAAVARMVVDRYGNAGIGTTSPGDRLHVAGNMRVNGEVWVNSARAIDTAGVAIQCYYAP